MTSISSRPKLPPSPACGFSAATADPRPRQAGALQRAVDEIDRLANARLGDRIGDVAERDMARDPARPNAVERVQLRDISLDAQLGGHVMQFVVMTEPGGVQRRLVQRREKNGVDDLLDREIEREVEQTEGGTARGRGRLCDSHCVRARSYRFASTRRFGAPSSPPPADRSRPIRSRRPPAPDRGRAHGRRRSGAHPPASPCRARPAVSRSVPDRRRSDRPGSRPASVS